MIKNSIFLIFKLIYYIFRKIKSDRKSDAQLLQDFHNIEKNSQLIEDKKIINFLKKYIKIVEVSIRNQIFRLYFPMLDKANVIEEVKNEYLNAENCDASDFMNYLINNYDEIYLRGKVYVLIKDKFLSLPITNFIFKNIYVYGILLLIFSVVINLLILLSFSTFTRDCNENCLEDDENCYTDKGRMLYYPHLFYECEHSAEQIEKTFVILGIIILILQGLIFVDYIFRIFFVENKICLLKYDIEKEVAKIKDEEYEKKDNGENGGNEKIKKSLNKCLYRLKAIFNCLFNFRSIYYILNIIFILLGLKCHPFFYCLSLLEFVNRIQTMKKLLSAMYKPLKNIFITSVMLVIMEYFFTLFGLSYFTYDFPNVTDSKKLYLTFMRMIDQTFKQDGGIGTYLKKELDPNYEPYYVSAYLNLKFFFDLIFYLFIIVIMLQIFFSIIIDYFNKTREKTEKFNEELEKQCIVCGMHRERIEEIYVDNRNPFDSHVYTHHNAFSYIYYLMYLQSSSYRDEIVDNTIWNLHLKKDLSYIPKNKCFKQLGRRCLKIHESEDN